MKIEELINERKDQLDIEQPPEDAWGGIKQKWQQKQTKTTIWWKVAAILMVALSIGLFINNQHLKREVSKLASLSDFSDKYSIIEKSYITEIKSIENNIPIMELKTQEEYQWLFEELTLLEEVNNMYRSDIGKVNEEQLVGILIDYYEKKIKLLKKLELELERNSKQTKNEATINDHISI